MIPSADSPEHRRPLPRATNSPRWIKSTFVREVNWIDHSQRQLLISCLFSHKEGLVLRKEKNMLESPSLHGFHQRSPTRKTANHLHVAQDAPRSEEADGPQFVL